MTAWLSQGWAAILSFVGSPNEGEIRMLTAIVSVAAVIISVLAITSPLRYQKSAALLDLAVRVLERACNALTVDGTQLAPVPADRLNWLTAARNLETYKALKREIRVEVHRRLVEDHEEHWRHLFYLALDGNAYHQPTYYREVTAPAPREQRRSGIKPHSEAIVHAFAKWPKYRLDPVEHADFDLIFGETDPRPGNIGLKLFLNDPTAKGNARFRDLPETYPERTLWTRCIQTLHLRKRL